MEHAEGQQPCQPLIDADQKPLDKRFGSPVHPGQGTVPQGSERSHVRRCRVPEGPADIYPAFRANGS